MRLRILALIGIRLGGSGSFCSGSGPMPYVQLDLITAFDVAPRKKGQ
jgi:hypothetical protein